VEGSSKEKEKAEDIEVKCNWNQKVRSRGRA
jgi:hypothetical protein